VAAFGDDVRGRGYPAGSIGPLWRARSFAMMSTTKKQRAANAAIIETFHGML
jgi:hypothetical protein